jgi:hypothetical protein
MDNGESTRRQKRVVRRHSPPVQQVNIPILNYKYYFCQWPIGKSGYLERKGE